MQNEKELIRPRRLCLRRELPEPGARNFACGAKYLAARWFGFACGANYPHQALAQALKGGMFFIFVGSTHLTRLDVIIFLSMACRFFSVRSLHVAGPEVPCAGQHAAVASARVQAPVPDHQ